VDDHMAWHASEAAKRSKRDASLADRISRLERLMISLIADGKVDLPGLEELLEQ
jgi:hypothetical protein